MDASTVKEMVGSLHVMRHCGTAQVTVQTGGKSYLVQGGNCEKTAKSFVMNVGRTVLDLKASEQQRSRIDYVGLVSGITPALQPGATPVPADGTYTKGVTVVGTIGGAIIGLKKVVLTLENDRSSGAWRGTTFDGTSENGTFSCGG